MEIKKIIKTCLVKMGVEDFLDQTYDQEQAQLVKQLVQAFNVAYSEAVTTYMPLTTEEVVVVNNGIIDCTALDKQIIHPVRLVDKIGTKHRYHVMPTTLLTDFSGEGVLTYAYAPREYTLDETLEDLRFTPELLAEGALAVYYFALRAFDLASVHDDNFRQGVKSMKHKGREIVIKERRWSA